MPQLPEQIRPFVAALAKYHFWILAAIVPILLVPLLLMGTTALDTLITGQKSQIDTRISALNAVRGIAEHPNEAWSEAVEQQTRKIREETLSEWQTFWSEQAPLRVWSSKLGDPFQKAVATLKPGGVLKKEFLVRYQNTVPELVRELPKRMGSDDFMLEGSGPNAVGGDSPPGPRGFGGEFGGRPGGEFGPRPGSGLPGAGSGALVEWSAADQKRLFDSFKWEKPPSTTQVLLAQEELWAYGLLCDVIKKVNDGAAGPFESPIGLVSELAVGYPAAEDQPGGQGGGRVFMAAAPAAGGGEFSGEAPAPDMSGGMAAPAGRPANPRFSGASGGGLGGGPGGRISEFGGGEGGMDPAAAPVASPDEQLKEWIYVDFSGKPLTAAELTTVPSAKLVHLMPFVLRVTMDQRKLDALLADLALNPVPIDVRQVRINPSQQPGGASPMGRGEFAASPSMPVDGAAGSSGRPFDVVVELRGTVGLAPPPDAAAIGAGDTPAGEGGA